MAQVPPVCRIEDLGGTRAVVSNREIDLIVPSFVGRPRPRRRLKVYATCGAESLVLSMLWVSDRPSNYEIANSKVVSITSPSFAAPS